jgi:hypothetical protein
VSKTRKKLRYGTPASPISQKSLLHNGIFPLFKDRKNRSPGTGHQRMNGVSAEKNIFHVRNQRKLRKNDSSNLLKNSPFNPAKSLVL